MIERWSRSAPGCRRTQEMHTPPTSRCAAVSLVPKFQLLTHWRLVEGPRLARLKHHHQVHNLGMETTKGSIAQAKERAHSYKIELEEKEGHPRIMSEVIHITDKLRDGNK